MSEIILLALLLLLIKELRKMGATDKSTVIIGGEEFEFVD